MSFTEATDSDLAMQPIFHNRSESESRLLHSPDATARGRENSVASQEQILTPGSTSAPSRSDAAWQRRSRRKLWSPTIHSTACLLVFGLVVASTMGSVMLILPNSYIYISLPNSYGFISPCDTSGNFNPTSNNPSFWSPSRAFQITMGFGAMSFSSAKLIDVAWDVIIGRGGQALLAFISYQVFTKSLTRLMERSSVNLEVFESLALSDTVSVASIFVLMKDFVAKGTARARFSMLWIILASVYALFFQTLMSAMTGYSATTTPYVQIPPGGNQIPWSDMRAVKFIVHDGWRIGLTNNYICTDLMPEDDYYTDAPCINYEGYPDNDIPERCLLLVHISSYSNEYLSQGVQQIASFFPYPKNSSSSIELSPPTLNITQPTDYYTPNDLSTNQTYDLNYLVQYGLCSQEKTYQWGFSGLLLFFAIVLTTIWAIGMWAMWLDAYYQSNLDFYGRQLGKYRAVLDLAEVLQRELGENGDTSQLSEQALRRRTKKVQFNATISYAKIVTRNATSNRSAEIGRWLNRRRWGRWIMRHKLWSTVLAVITLSGLIVLVILLPFFVSYS